MKLRPLNRSICNSHGIRVYPVPVYGSYYMEIEFNKTPDFDPRYIRRDSKGKPMVYRGKERYDPKKKDWLQKIDSMYDELYEKKVKPKLERASSQNTKAA